MIGRRFVIVPLILLGLAAACGDSGTSAEPSEPPVTTAAGRGWIGGEPEWSAAGEGDGAVDMAEPAVAEAPEVVETRAAGDVATDAAVPPVDGSPLRAGSVDDNADFDGFLAYLARYREMGLPDRSFDPTGRVVIRVVGDGGLPAMGLPVTVSAEGAEVTTLLTGPSGVVYFLPALHGTPAASYHVATAGSAADVAPGGELTLTVPATSVPESVPVDVLFLLDVTGSMDDEISRLKETIDQVAAQLAELPQQPDLRLAMTLYRDEGDAFVASTFDFTADVAEFRGALADVVADGGGDTPEALEEGFAAALAEPSWRPASSAVQLMFLVGDAAPHSERQLELPWTESIKEAGRRGLTVHSIGASSTDDTAEHTFRGIAQATGGRFVFLSYGAGGAAVGVNSDITATDYEEMSLDALVVRLVAESLSTLTGTEVVPPSTVPDTVPVTQPSQ